MNPSGPIALVALFAGGFAVAALPTGRAPMARAASGPFHLVVDAGQTLIVDTSSATLTDAGGNVETFSQGNVFVDTLEVKAGGRIFGQGPHSLRFFVTNDAVVAGEIRVDGGNGPNVVTINNATASVAGGKGNCGGGDGGLGNPQTTQSSSTGGTGKGSWQATAAGAHGGESALLCCGATPCQELEDMHPAGGGGGSLATLGEPGAIGTPSINPYNLGLCGGTGTPAPNSGTSAVNPTHESLGGAIGAPAFATVLSTDDYFGASVFRVGSFSTGTTTTVVSSNPMWAFVPDDVGRWIGFHKLSAEASWESNCASPENPATCPRSRYLLRRITGVVTDSGGSTTATFEPPLPAAPILSDTWAIYGAGPLHPGDYATRLGGQGGGGGGNSIFSTAFPNPGFANQDAVGGGGGAGGGVLEIIAFGKIVVSGTISANGGAGGGGESKNGIDRLGGGGGGGSGGMIRLQSAALVDLSSPTASLLARGGARGPGLNDVAKDPIPPSNPSGIGHGGRGGNGVIQIHAPLDENRNPIVLFAPGQPVSARFDPAPYFALPELSPDPATQRSIWFGSIH